MEPLVPCNGPGDCDWKALFDLFQNILDWFIIVAPMVATIAFAYAGWLLIWGGSVNSSKVSEAKSIFTKAAIGLAAVLAAALIVKAILYFLAREGFQIIT